MQMSDHKNTLRMRSSKRLHGELIDQSRQAHEMRILQDGNMKMDSSFHFPVLERISSRFQIMLRECEVCN